MGSDPKDTAAPASEPSAPSASENPIDKKPPLPIPNIPKARKPSELSAEEKAELWRKVTGKSTAPKYDPNGVIPFDEISFESGEAAREE